VSLYGLVIVVASFYIKKHIGQKTWRLIHFASLGVFMASLIHGVSAGTDTRTPLMIGLYVGSAGVVGLLLAARLTGGETGRSPRLRGSGLDATDRSASRVPTSIADTR
jgi:sulfoxide reductase heme-binding subunit YedZ